MADRLAALVILLLAAPLFLCWALSRSGGRAAFIDRAGLSDLPRILDAVACRLALVVDGSQPQTRSPLRRARAPISMPTRRGAGRSRRAA